MKHRPLRSEPARCQCEPGRDTPREHGKPGAKAADHGNVFTHRRGCIHSELIHTTKPRPRKKMVARVR